jgi:glycosyltransferase involved in cell wall biosynthesis
MGAPLKREQRKQLKNLSNVQVYESEFKLEWMENPWSDVARAGDWLLEIESRVRPDIIHLNGYAHGSLPWNAPKIVVGHSCVLSWWKSVKKCEAPDCWDEYAVAARKGLRAADLVVAPTRAMLDFLKFYYGPFASEKVIFNARNPALFHTRVKEEFIMAAGRLWDEAKNISALGVVAPQIPWSIYVAGEEKNPNGRAAKNEFKALCPLGRLPSDLLAKWLGRASIYAAPALYEPFGLSILEAALSGCALVLGNISSLREIWNGAATFVSPNDPTELKFALDRLIQNPFRRKEMAAYAQCRAIQFNPKRMAAEYFAAYTEVLANPRRTEPRRLFANSDVLSHAVV